MILTTVPRTLVKVNILQFLRNIDQARKEFNEPINNQLVLYFNDMNPDIIEVVDSLLELNIFGLITMEQIEACSPDLYRIITDSMEIVVGAGGIDPVDVPMKRNWKLHHWKFDLNNFRRVMVTGLIYTSNTSIHDQETQSRIAAYNNIIHIYCQKVERNLDPDNFCIEFQ